MPLTLSGNGTISDLASAPTVGGTALPTNSDLPTLTTLGIANHNNISVDSSGRISNSNPAFNGTREGFNTQNLTGNIPLTSQLDTASSWNNSTYVYTAPKAGRYFVSIYNLTNGSGNGAANIELRVNGLTKHQGYSSSGSAEPTRYFNVGVSAVVDIQESDTISWYHASSYVVYSSTYAGMSIIYLG